MALNPENMLRAKVENQYFPLLAAMLNSDSLPMEACARKEKLNPNLKESKKGQNEHSHLLGTAAKTL